MHLRNSVAVLLALASTRAGAAQIDHINFRHEGTHYRVDMSVHLDAPAPRAFAVFADPAQLREINPAVRVATRVDAETTQNRLYTEVHLCVVLFCHTLRQVQNMHYEPATDGGHMSADVLPERSDLRYGHAEWTFVGDAHATQLHFSMDIEPAFWMPPVIGPWLIEHSLREQAARTSAGIERLANAS